MTPAQFLETRRPAWDRLAVLVKKAGRRGVGALEEAELHELSRLYPAVAVDVARARMYELDPATQRRVNSLAIAAHGLLYRPPRPRPLRAVARFFSAEYPRLFRRLWPYTALAAAIFLVGALGAYAMARMRPATAYVFVEGGIAHHDPDEQAPAEEITERWSWGPRSPTTAFYWSNNIRVALVAFALGITAGLGTCFVLLVNAMMLGAFVAHFQNHHLGYECVAFLAGHGVLEIFAILVAGGAGLRLGLSLAVPGGLTRRASLRAGAREAVLLLLGTVPMFVLAGVMEGFVTPSRLPPAFKLVLGLLLGATTLAYLLSAGRKERARAG